MTSPLFGLSVNDSSGCRRGFVDTGNGSAVLFGSHSAPRSKCRDHLGSRRSLRQGAAPHQPTSRRSERRQRTAGPATSAHVVRGERHPIPGRYPLGPADADVTAQAPPGGAPAAGDRSDRDADDDGARADDVCPGLRPVVVIRHINASWVAARVLRQLRCPVPALLRPRRVTRRATLGLDRDRVGCVGAGAPAPGGLAIGGWLMHLSGAPTAWIIRRSGGLFSSPVPSTAPRPWLPACCSACAGLAHSRSRSCRPYWPPSRRSCWHLFLGCTALAGSSPAGSTAPSLA